jgi:hypothetical protein
MILAWPVKSGKGNTIKIWQLQPFDQIDFRIFSITENTTIMRLPTFICKYIFTQ